MMHGQKNIKLIQMLMLLLLLLLLHNFIIKEMQVQYFLTFPTQRKAGDINFSFPEQYKYSRYIKHHISLFLICFYWPSIPLPSTPSLTSVALFFIFTISSTKSPAPPYTCGSFFWQNRRGIQKAT
jgi:hypothetical protein